MKAKMKLKNSVDIGKTCVKFLNMLLMRKVSQVFRHCKQQNRSVLKGVKVHVKILHLNKTVIMTQEWIWKCLHVMQEKYISLLIHILNIYLKNLRVRTMQGETKIPLEGLREKMESSKHSHLFDFQQTTFRIKIMVEYWWHSRKKKKQTQTKPKHPAAKHCCYCSYTKHRVKMYLCMLRQT